MKIKTSIRDRKGERDTMRPEYDFSAAVRGVTVRDTPQAPTSR